MLGRFFDVVVSIPIHSVWTEYIACSHATIWNCLRTRLSLLSVAKSTKNHPHLVKIAHFEFRISSPRYLKRMFLNFDFVPYVIFFRIYRTNRPSAHMKCSKSSYLLILAQVIGWKSCKTISCIWLILTLKTWGIEFSFLLLYSRYYLVFLPTNPC